MKIDDIVAAIDEDSILITSHARREAEDDSLLLDEICFSVKNGEIIEDYSDDKPFPSCLINGFNQEDEPIHTVWAYNEQKQLAILITVYRPDPNLWLNWQQRRKR